MDPMGLFGRFSPGNPHILGRRDITQKFWLGRGYLSFLEGIINNYYRKTFIHGIIKVSFKILQHTHTHIHTQEVAISHSVLMLWYYTIPSCFINKPVSLNEHLGGLINACGTVTCISSVDMMLYGVIIWSLWFHIYLPYVPWTSYVVKLTNIQMERTLLQQCQTNFKVVWRQIPKPVLIQNMMQKTRLKDLIDALLSPITPCGKKKLMLMPVL